MLGRGQGMMEDEWDEGSHVSRVRGCFGQGDREKRHVGTVEPVLLEEPAGAA